MASNIEQMFFEYETIIGARGEPGLYERSVRVVTTAHPFTNDDLLEFASSGEHLGLE